MQLTAITFQATNGLGAVPGARLFSYVAGTLTPQATYTRADLAEPNSNPVVCDASGQAAVWLDPELTYRLRLETPYGGLIADRDNVDGGWDDSSGYVDTMLYGAGTVGAELQARIPVVSSIASLQSRSKTTIGSSVMVTGYYAVGDGGGGLYRYDPTDTSSTDNGGTIIVASDGGRWKLNYTGAVSLRQFGAVGDNVTVDTVAVQAAITWATATLTRSLWAPSGAYVIDGAITKPSNFIGLTLRGDGMGSTIFRFTGTAGLVTIGGSGGLCYGEVSDICFTGISTTVLVEIQGQCGQKFRHCRFDTGSVGIRFHNQAAGQFTEYCTGETCDFTANCSFPVQYKRTSGDDSFNGSGLTGQCTINSSPSATIVLIDLGCRPYNSPFFAQVWGNSNCTVFVNNNTSTTKISFYGQLNLERFAGTMTLGAGSFGNEIPFAGKLVANNENFAFGAFFLCDAVVLTSVGSRQTIGGRYSRSQALTTGANVIGGVPYSMSEGQVTYFVHIVGPNYDYRYRVGSWNVMSSGLAPIEATYATNNTAGWGAPTFSINSSQQLVITNTNWPASGVTAFLDCSQGAQSISQAFVGA